MRAFLSSLAVFGFLLTAGAAEASPMMRFADDADGLVQQVQFICDPQRCIDRNTGAFTESGCNRRGCYPIGGIKGYIGGGGRAIAPRYRGGYDDGYEEDYRPRRRGYGYGGQWDCNYQRCINTATGRLHESNCDARGCRPGRPARQPQYGW